MIWLEIGEERHHLVHGADPDDRLAHHGWSGARPTWARAEGEDLVITYDGGTRGETGGDAFVVAPPRVEDEPTGAPPERQRPAAYAVCVEDGAVLLCRIAASVPKAAGLWTLPGGGLDPGEDPVAGLVREVWEEAGQHAEVGELLEVQADHWVGESPRGVVEDFQAVRLVYRARCTPEPARVTEVDGSTDLAAWVPLDDPTLTTRPATRLLQAALPLVLGPQTPT